MRMPARWADGASKDLSEAQAVSQEIRPQRESEQPLAVFVLLSMLQIPVQDRIVLLFTLICKSILFKGSLEVKVFVAFQTSAFQEIAVQTSVVQ